MRVFPVLAFNCLLLLGCSSSGNGGAPGPALANGASSAESPATASAQAPAPALSDPSYEVAIATAQADRMHALEVCDAKGKPERSACNKEADAAYDGAKATAQNFQEAGQ